jgi:LemA protein
MDLSTILFISLALLLIIIFYFVAAYNRLQSLRNGAEATLSQIRVAMKKRLDMVEQLVASLKSYAHFEQETLVKITRLRTGLGDAGPADIQKINSDSRSLFAEIKGVAESYPNLKTSEAVIATMNAIREVEDEISRQRYTYNNIIQEFNTMLDTMPSSFIGSSAGLHKQEYLNFEEDELRQKGYLTSEVIEPRLPEAKWD